MQIDVETWLASFFGTPIAILLLLAFPSVRSFVGKYFASLMQLHFDQRIEHLKSELRRSEQQFEAELNENDRQLRALTDVTLSLRSTRQAALDARRLEAVEKLWKTKIARDRLKGLTAILAHIRLDALFAEAAKDAERFKMFGKSLERSIGADLTKVTSEISAQSERPFLPPEIWNLFSAYEAVMFYSAMVVKFLSLGTAELLNKEDTLKPIMLQVLPEYKNYIEEHGYAGYYYLLEPLEKKLLSAIYEMLDGKATDNIMLTRSAEIISAVQEHDMRSRVNIPENLKAEDIPMPSAG